MRRLSLVVLAAVAVALCGGGVSAQDIKGPIKIVVPYPAGGGSDVVARLIADKLKDSLGQTVIVENKPGAGGRIGTEYAKGQPADGTTMLVSPDEAKAVRGFGLRDNAIDQRLARGRIGLGRRRQLPTRQTATPVGRGRQKSNVLPIRFRPVGIVCRPRLILRTDAVLNLFESGDTDLRHARHRPGGALLGRAGGLLGGASAR